MSSVFSPKHDRAITYVCSISPIPVVWNEGRHVQRDPETGEVVSNGVSRYEIPACAKIGDYQVLPIVSTEKTGREPNPEGGEPRRTVIPLPSTAIARDLISHVIQNGPCGSTPGHSLGIGVIEGPEPTKEELEKLNRAQINYLRTVVADGQRLSVVEPQSIQQLHRIAVDYLGLGAQHGWAASATSHQLQTKPCPACAEEIRLAAVICKHCRTDLREFEGGVPVVPETPPQNGQIVDPVALTEDDEELIAKGVQEALSKTPPPPPPPAG